MEELLKQILKELKDIKKMKSGKQPIKAKGIYTVQELADYLECDYGVVLKWTNHGLKHRRLGRRIYILGKNILDFVDEEKDLQYTESSKDRIERKLSKVKYT